MKIILKKNFSKQFANLSETFWKLNQEMTYVYILLIVKYVKLYQKKLVVSTDCNVIAL
jgi:hypothetical protein